MTLKISKAFELIDTFTSTEKKAFQAYIQLHTSNKIILLCYDNYLKLIATKKIWDKKVLFQKMFGKVKEHDDQLLRNLFFQLQNLAEDFILVYIAQQTPTIRYKLLATEYRKRGLSKHTGHLIEKWQDVPTHYSLEENYWLQVEKHLYIDSLQNRSKEPNIQEMSNSLDSYYLLEKLKIYIKAISYENIINIKYNIHFIEEILRTITPEVVERYPSIQLYYAMLQLLKNPQEGTHYTILKNGLLHNIDKLPLHELKDNLAVAKNYCIKQINHGKAEFFNELMEWYKFELQHFASKKTMSPLTYKNIVYAGLSVKDYEWINNFMEEYKKLLPAEESQAYYQLCKATYYFELQSFHKVAKLLYQVDYKDVFVDMAIKALLLKTYYELQEYEQLRSLCQSFKVFLRRKQILNYHRKGYYNLILYMYKVLQAEEWKDLDKITLAIQEHKEFMDRNWINAKIAQKRKELKY